MMKKLLLPLLLLTAIPLVSASGVKEKKVAKETIETKEIKKVVDKKTKKKGNWRFTKGFLTAICFCVFIGFFRIVKYRRMNNRVKLKNLLEMVAQIRYADAKFLKKKEDEGDPIKINGEKMNPITLEDITKHLEELEKSYEKSDTVEEIEETYD